MEDQKRERYTYQIRLVSNRGWNRDALYADGMYLHSNMGFLLVVLRIRGGGFWTNWAGDNVLLPSSYAHAAGLTWIAPGAILWVKLARDRGEDWEK